MVEIKSLILAVDDEPDICRLVKRVLESAGYQVITASDGNQVSNLVAQRNPGLVLLDILMPGKSGMEVFQELKISHPDIGVIMATAVGDANVAIDTLREGACDYLLKPFNVNELVISVTRALEKRRLVLENRDYQLNLEKKVAEQTKKIRDSFLNAITALAYALEARDEYTSGHSQRVAEISAAIARELGMSGVDIERIRLAGLIHDIGKIGIREHILNKSMVLTDEEFRHVKEHCQIGEHILSPIIEDKEVLKIVKHHHECYDGSGYPNGLSGQQIPFGGRILALADSYDAMISERPYRKAMGARFALVEIEHVKGSQFDPEVVDAFFRISGFPVATVA